MTRTRLNWIDFVQVRGLRKRVSRAASRRRRAAAGSSRCRSRPNGATSCRPCAASCRNTRAACARAPSAARSTRTSSVKASASSCTNVTSSPILRRPRIIPSRCSLPSLSLLHLMSSIKRRISTLTRGRKAILWRRCSPLRSVLILLRIWLLCHLSRLYLFSLFHFHLISFLIFINS